MLGLTVHSNLGRPRFGDLRLCEPLVTRTVAGLWKDSQVPMWEASTQVRIANRVADEADFTCQSVSALARVRALVAAAWSEAPVLKAPVLTETVSSGSSPSPKPSPLTLGSIRP